MKQSSAAILSIKTLNDLSFLTQLSPLKLAFFHLPENLSQYILNYSRPIFKPVYQATTYQSLGEGEDLPS